MSPRKKPATAPGSDVAGAALTLTTPDLSAQLQSEASELGEALTLVRDYRIEPVGAPGHEESLAFAEESRKLTKEQWAEYENQRTSVTGPLNGVLKTVNGWFRPVLTTLKAMETAWNQKIVDAATQAAAAQRALIAEARATEAPAIMKETLVEASAMVLRPSAVTLRDNWVFEVYDPAAVPQEYLCPDLEKIGKVVGVLKDKTAIPGVRAWNATIVASRPGQ